MKKALLFISALVWSVISVAQQGTLQVGAFGGSQSTWLINKNDSNDPNVVYADGWRGFGGISVDYNFAEQAGVGLEFEYSKQGQNYNYPVGYGTGQYKKVVDYFKIPLLLNFTSNPERPVMFVGKVGPYLGLATGADLKQPGTPTTDILYNFRGVNAGGILGLGLGINIAKVAVITVGIRLDGGFTDALVSNPDPTYFSYYGGTREKTWSVAGGPEIGFKYIIHVTKSSHGYHRR